MRQTLVPVVGDEVPINVQGDLYIQHYLLGLDNKFWRHFIQIQLVLYVKCFQCIICVQIFAVCIFRESPAGEDCMSMKPYFP